MRNPTSLNSTESPHPNIIKITNPPEYDIMEWDLDDPKDYKKFISTVEKCVRGSYEYKQMISYLRKNLHMNQCSFFSNVSSEDFNKVRIEIHHEPLSLYDIVKIVIRKRQFYMENLDEELVAKEVMMLHYKLIIGLIPLSETVHELVHNKYIFIPTTKVFGHYKAFVNLYKQFIFPEEMEVLDDIERATACYTDDQYKDVLARNYIYIDFTGETTLPPYKEIKALMESRMKLLESNQDSKSLKQMYIKF